MDQKYVVGVGNIYANEALFAAGIDPSKPANQVSPEAWDRLHREMRRILNAAIDSEGTTFRDYMTGNGQPGNFQLELQVYERAGEPCRTCGTTAGQHPRHRCPGDGVLLAVPAVGGRVLSGEYGEG